MNVLKFFNQDPDEFIGSFEPITVWALSNNCKATIELGLVKETNKLYFVIGKRLTSDGTLLILDQVSVSLASQKVFKERPPHWARHGMYRTEFLRLAFESFVQSSPFSGFVRTNISPLVITQLFAKLRTYSPNLISFLQGSSYEEERGDNSVSRPS